jgi:hypothetical protein
LSLRHIIIDVKELAPLAVAHLDGAFGRADDVAEENRGQDTNRISFSAGARQKLFDLVGNRVSVTGKRQMIVARQLNQTRIRQVLQQELSVFNSHQGVSDPL